MSDKTIEDIWEVLDSAALELDEQRTINKLLLAYIEADLKKTWEPAAKRLAKKLKEITK